MLTHRSGESCTKSKNILQHWRLSRVQWPLSFLNGTCLDNQNRFQSWYPDKLSYGGKVLAKKWNQEPTGHCVDQTRLLDFLLGIMFGGNTSPRPFLQWSLVGSASCCGGDFLQLGQRDSSGKMSVHQQSQSNLTQRICQNPESPPHRSASTSQCFQVCSGHTVMCQIMLISFFYFVFFLAESGLG